MRRYAALMVFGSVLIAGCSDRALEQSGEPSLVSNPSTSPIAVCDPDPLVTASRIEGLITQLFSGGNQNAALSRFDQIQDLLTPAPPYDVAAAQNQTYDLIGYALDKYNQGQLNDVAAPGGTAQALTDMINLMFCYAGIADVIGPIGLDGAAALYQPGSPPLLLIAPSGNGGISLPAGTGNVTQPTIISLNRIQPDFPGPLLTSLDQYPLYYEFDTSSGETFLQDAVISVCVAQNLTIPDETRLRLAHNVPEPNFTTIEILPAGTSFLDCTGAQAIFPSLGSTGGGIGTFARRAFTSLATRVFEALEPQPLYAAALVTGVTGTTKRLSPFGSVDTLANLSALSPTTGLTAPQGGTVTAPLVLVSTPADAPMAGITVTFTVTAGGGTLTAVGSSTPVTSVITTTDAQGNATVGSWTLGTGTNTVTAVATPPHAGSGIAPAAGITFTAIATAPAKLAFGTQPATTSAGTPFSVTVLVQDAAGNTVPASSAVVTLSMTGATLNGTKTVAAVNGVATFTGLSITKAGTYTLKATSPGLTMKTSNSFSITAGPAVTLARNAGQNQTAPAGSVLGVTAGTVAPSVKVSDQYGNRVSGVVVTFLVNRGGGTATPTTAVTNANGIASTNWLIGLGANRMSVRITVAGVVRDVAFAATGT
jgi:hypothetical protein